MWSFEEVLVFIVDIVFRIRKIKWVFYIYPSFCPFFCHVGYYTTSQKFEVIKIFELFERNLMLTEAAFIWLKYSKNNNMRFFGTNLNNCFLFE